MSENVVYIENLLFFPILASKSNILTVTHPKGTHVSNSPKRRKGIKKEQKDKPKA